MKKQNSRKKLQQKITDQMIASLETAEASNWEKGWASAGLGGLPHNPVTNRTYSGQNTVFLAFSGFESSAFAGYGQWAKIGANVKRGEKATTVVKWTPFESTKLVETPEGEEEVTTTYWNPMPLNVFNSEQVDGWEAPTVEPINPDQRSAAIDDFVKNTEARIKEVQGDRAFYRPADDSITMPTFGQFKTSYGFYSVLMHELAHWTGTSERCDRDKTGNSFGNAGYAREELVAELSSVYTCAHLGLQNEPNEQNSSYVKGWLQALRNDPTWIFKVAKDASDASEYLIKKQESK